MFLLVQTEKSLYNLDLSKTISGRFYIHHEGKLIAYIRACKNIWQLCANDGILINQKETCVFLYERDTHVLCDKDAHQIMVYVKKHVAYTYQKYSCFQSFNIGRNKGCDIVYDNPFVSNVHAKIKYLNNQFYMQDEHSSNHTYVNGKRFESGKLDIGDIITIMGLQIIVGTSFWSICDEEKKLITLSSLFQPYIHQEAPIKSKECLLIPNAYRPAPIYENKKMTIKEKPCLVVQKESPVWLKLGPSFMMGIIAIMNIIFMLQRTTTSTSIASLIPSILMSCSMLFTACLFPVLTQHYQKKLARKRNDEQEQEYALYIQSIEQKINVAKENEKHYLMDAFPTLEELYINKAYGFTTIQDVHFLTLRVGMGTRTASITLEGNTAFSILIESAPIYVDLKEQYLIGITGEKKDTDKFVESMLTLACFVHGKDDLKVVCIGKKIPEGLRWLPHLDYLNMRCYLKDEESVLTFQGALQREIELKNSQPMIILCLFDNELEECFSLLEEIRSQPFKGISLITCAPHKDKFSHMLLDLEHHKYYVRDHTEGNAITFDNSPFVKQSIRFLANLKNGHTSFQMPTIYPFLSMFSIHTVEELNVWKRWEQHQSYKTLSTPIGLHENGQLLQLNIHEKAHGPHGLIAGMTGSGKSECILTYLLSMAVNYHPLDVQFLIIDYKGGGLAKVFEPLPHTVGILTNLDESLLQRAFLSIQSEVVKRQKVLKETALRYQIANLGMNEYQKLYYEQKVKIPFAQLLIVCDEFAELKMQQPMFMDQLISTARIGRSLGIHLMLATQKPSGIVNDQIWSNTHFHLCMKVADKADSMDMIHRYDSAYLKDSGQFYLQIGNNEAFMKGLCAWSQAPYEEEGRPYMEQSIKVVSSTKQIISEVKSRDIVKRARETQFEAIMQHLVQCAKMKDIKKYQVWLPPLLESKYLGTLEKTYKCLNDHVLMGEIDDPTHQCYLGFYIPVFANSLLYANRDLQIFLETFIASFVHTFSCKKNQFIGIDMIEEDFLKSSNISFFTTFITGREHEKIQILFETLHAITKRETRDPESFVYIILHGISTFEKEYSMYIEKLHYFLREGANYHIYFFITAKHEDEIAYRIRPFFTNSYVMYMDRKEELSSILNSQMKQTITYQKGKGYFYNQRVQEFQIASVIKGEIRRNEQW